MSIAISISNSVKGALVPGGGGGGFVNEYSMTFDGNLDYITMGNPASLQITGALTLSAWVKRDSTATSSNYQIIGKDNVTSARCYALGINTATNQVRFNIFISNIQKSVIGTTVLSSDVWYHIMAVNDGTDLKIYVNGVLDGTNVGGGGTIDNDATNFNIGRRDAGVNSGYWSGKIDEVAVWNSDQSSNINSIYSSSGALDLSSLNPVSWWRMGDGDTFSTNWTLTDNGSGGNDGTSVSMSEGARLPISPNSYSQNSFVFDGSTDYVDLGDLSAVLSAKTSASVSLWFKRDTTTNQFLFDLKEGTSRIGMQLYFGTSIYFYLNNKYYLHPTATAINNWYNLIFVFNGNGVSNEDKLKMYLNRTELTGGTYSGTIDTAIGVFTSSMTSNIGRTPSTAYFNGNIDEVYVWNNDQSGNISTIYGNGVPTDISSLNPISHWRMGESATWDGANWTLTDQGSGGNNATSVSMPFEAKTGDQPYVL